jgi:transposase-like protein
MRNGLSLASILNWTDDECRDYLEKQRWPDGPICPKCGEPEPYRLTRRTVTKNTNRSLYKCRSCRRQFTVTLGTVFEDSHIPLNKWFAAIYLMCSSKKGISAHQIHRTLDVTYRSAWFMCHRVREAMRDKSPTFLSGIIEADETLVGGRGRNYKTNKRESAKRRRENKSIVCGMVERGGRARTMQIPDASGQTIEPILLANIELENSRLFTDEAKVYHRIRNHLDHEIVAHKYEWARGEVHTNSIESYWAILKRGIIGVFHHIGIGYVPSYLNEFEYRFNRRKISDAERFADLMSRPQGRVLWYCLKPQPKNPYA